MATSRQDHRAKHGFWASRIKRLRPRERTSNALEDSNGAGNFEGYAYRPLDPLKNEIRLLICERQSGTRDGSPLRFTVFHVSLRSISQKYIAIDYSWGNVKSQSKIFLDGRASEIPSSAEHALKRILGHGQLTDIFGNSHELSFADGLLIWIDNQKLLVSCTNAPTSSIHVSRLYLRI